MCVCVCMVCLCVCGMCVCVCLWCVCVTVKISGMAGNGSDPLKSNSGPVGHQ